jgi:hypothetical protein
MTFEIKNEENRLLGQAAGLKGTAGIEHQLEQKAAVDGFSSDQIRLIVGRVLNRLNKTESGKQGGALGVPHKANDRFKAIKKTVSQAVI